jgi:hypothetical protein
MGFLDSLLGRSKPKPPNLDALFALPSAAITLEAGLGFAPTGFGSVCYRATQGGAFAATQTELQQLLDADDGPDVKFSTDSYGYTWLLVEQAPTDVAALATDLHAVNTSLEAQGFGPQLLCTLIGFRDSTGRAVGLVYLYKQGTFYPFAPAPGGGERRDSVLEMQIKSLVENDLRLEPDTSRWFPVWGAPGL